VAKLMACKTCSKQIAAEAKTCPNCGARNKRSSWILRFFVALLVLAGIGLFIADGSNDASDSSGFPECTSDRAASDFKKAFDGGQYARTRNLSTIDVVDQTTVSDDLAGEKRVCQATLMLNNTQKRMYRFTFTLAKDGQYGHYYIEGQPVGH
jgi:hypothetical protein